MKESLGIIKDIIINENNIEDNITFNVEVNNNILSIMLPPSPLLNNIYVNDQVIVIEDIVLGKKVYDIKTNLGDYHV